MKCEKCPALASSGYEYREEYCSVGGDVECECEWKDGSYGCRLHPMTVRKRLRENEEALENQYQDIIEWYSEKDFSEANSVNISDVNGKYVSFARHCVGLDHKKPYIRHGKKFYKPYRNRYDAGGNDIAVWDTLVSIGYAYKDKMYHLTPAGLRWLGRILDVTIHPESR